MREIIRLPGGDVPAGTPDAAAHSPAPCADCDIVELRQYTLHAGRRDAFIAFFEREFIETQEAVGNTVIGQFRDLDDPDHFTWLRGFRDMPGRAVALQAFYGGDVWKAHREEANAFFIDSDDVLLLRAVRPQSALDVGRLHRAPRGTATNPPGLLVATIHSFDGEVDSGFVDAFERKLRPAMAESGIDLRGYYTSELTPNNFPRLPVRDKDRVFVWFALYASVDDHARRFSDLAATPAWQIAARSSALIAPPAPLRLTPTPRSRLHG